MDQCPWTSHWIPQIILPSSLSSLTWQGAKHREQNKPKPQTKTCRKMPSWPTSTTSRYNAHCGGNPITSKEFLNSTVTTAADKYLQYQADHTFTAFEHLISPSSTTSYSVSSFRCIPGTWHKFTYPQMDYFYPHFSITILSPASPWLLNWIIRLSKESIPISHS